MEILKDPKSAGSIAKRNGSNPFFSPKPIQAKLEVNCPGDVYEVEADQVAERVLENISDSNTTENSVKQKASSTSESINQSGISNPLPTSPSKNAAPNHLQTKSDDCGTEEILGEDEVQRKFDSGIFLQAAGTDDEDSSLMTKRSITSIPMVSKETTAQMFASKGGGDPLQKNTRAEMERGFGVDFSGVRIHNGPSAAEMSKNLGAQAFTHGTDIYFNHGKFDTQSKEGKRLIAHELTHVVQQRNDETQNLIHRKENILNKKIVKIIAFKGQLSGQAVLSDNTVVDISLSTNTLEELGTYNFLFDAGEQYNYRREDSDKRKGVIRWYPKDVYGEKYKERVISEKVEVEILEGDQLSQQVGLETLPEHIKNFLTAENGKSPSFKQIQDAIEVGWILVENNVSEEELLLKEIEFEKRSQQGISISRFELAWEIVNEKKSVAVKEDFISDSLNVSEKLGIKNQEVYGLLMAVSEKLDKEINFERITNAVGLSYTEISNAFEVVLSNRVKKALAESLIKLKQIESFYITDQVNVSIGRKNMEGAVGLLREALKERDKAHSDYERIELERGLENYKINKEEKIELEEKASIARRKYDSSAQGFSEISSNLGLNLPNIRELINQKSVQNSQGILKAFIFETRQNIYSALDKIKNPENLYRSDIIIKEAKEELKIKEKSIVDAIIKIKTKTVLADTWWDKFWETVSIISMFIPGPIGWIARGVTGLVNLISGNDDFENQNVLFDAGVSSLEPSSLELAVNIGSALLDAPGIAKGIGAGISKRPGMTRRMTSRLASGSRLDGDALKPAGDSYMRFARRGLPDGKSVNIIEGISDEAALKLMDIAKRENLFFSFRPVDEGVIRLRELGHPPKPEFLKMKTIKKLDVQLGANVADIDKVGFYVPVLPSNFDILPIVQQKALKELYEARIKEGIYLVKIKELVDAGVIKWERGVIVQVKSGLAYTGDYDLYEIRIGGKGGKSIKFEELKPEIQTELRGFGIEVQHGALIDWEIPEGLEEAYKSMMKSARSRFAKKPLVEFNPDGTATHGYGDEW